MNLISILNKTSPQVHTKLESDVFGVPGKLVKYVVHLSKKEKKLKNYFSSHKLAKQQSTNFWSQGTLGIMILWAWYNFPIVGRFDFFLKWN